MFKRFSIFLASVSVAVLPIAPVTAADSATAWSDLSVLETWEYDDVRVGRLSFTSSDLKKFGDTLVLVSRAEACSGSCALSDLHILKDGGEIIVKDVPTNAIDVDRYIQNDNRFVYAEFSNDEESRVNVIEIDLETGETTMLLEDVFIADADEVDITVDGDMIYATVTYDISQANESQPQSSVYVYYVRYGEFRQLYHQYRLQIEELVDVRDGEALVKMTFPGGEEQLWMYEYVDFGDQEAEAIGGTWTPAGEDMVAIHYTDDGSIEYFRFYTRHLTDASFGTTTTSADYLNWFRSYDLDDMTNIVQVVGDNMAWVNATDDLYVSDGDEVTKITNIGSTGTFTLTEDDIRWSNGYTGGISGLDGTVIDTVSFAPTDWLDTVVVGTTATNDVVYHDRAANTTLTLGFGENPKIADARHVYWKGEDARLYEATIDVSLSAAGGIPVKLSTGPEVYLLQEDTIAYVPSEDVFYTWFDSFASVQTITSTQYASYELVEGVGFKPGTLVKINDGSKVYMVGEDHELHWVVSPAVAISLNGTDWPTEVLSMTSLELAGYGYGDNIDSEVDAGDVMVATIE